MRVFFLYLIYFSFVFIAKAQTSLVLHGRVYDFERKTAIPYATIVISGNKTGVVADELGNFTLLLNASVQAADTVIFSSVAHQPKKILVEEATRITDIFLERNVAELKTAYVKPFLYSQNLGSINSRKTSPTRDGSYVGWSGDRLGGEVGNKFTSEQTPYRLEKLRFKFISGFDSAWLRLHIRNFTDSIPGDELLNEEIIIRIVKREGIIEYDLSRYALVFEEAICVSLELLRVADRPPGRSRALFLLTGQKPGSRYVKTFLTSTWTQEQEYELAMQLGIKY